MRRLGHAKPLYTVVASSLLMAKPPLIAFFLAIIAVLGTIYIADQAGWIDLQPPGEPRAQSIWEVSFLSTSDTDRTEASETISVDGHTITYVLTDANMDGLGDVELDIRVLNQNSGTAAESWPFRADLTFVTEVVANNFIVNTTGFDNRFDITWSLTESGEPTLTQIGTYAVSNDWKTGKSDQLNADLRMAPTATDDLTPSLNGKLVFIIGGITMTVNLAE